MGFEIMGGCFKVVLMTMLVVVVVVMVLKGCDGISRVDGDGSGDGNGSCVGITGLAKQCGQISLETSQSCTGCGGGGGGGGCQRQLCVRLIFDVALQGVCCTKTCHFREILNSSNCTYSYIYLHILIYIFNYVKDSSM